MNNYLIVIKKLKELKLFTKTNFIILYGSVSKGFNTPLSDIDLCISLNLPKTERLKARIKLSGNLPDNYDLQIFEDLPVYIKPEAISGKIIYCKNRSRLMDLAFQTIYESEEFKPYYNYYFAKDKSKVEI